MFANAATFLVSLLCLAGIRHREPRVTRTDHRPKSLVSEVREGLWLIADDPWFRTLTLFGAASNLALMGYQSIQVVFLVRSVGLTPGRSAYSSRLPAPEALPGPSSHAGSPAGSARPAPRCCSNWDFPCSLCSSR